MFLSKFIKPAALALTLLLTATDEESCSSDNSVTMKSDLNQNFAFEAMFYDNTGNNYVTFNGHSFDIDSNKVKQYGYDSEGSYISYYETSSIVSIDIDGHPVDTCGSTVLFKDTRLKLEPLDFNIGTLEASDESGYSVKTDKGTFEDWFELTHWWYKQKGNGEDPGAKVILIQSQDGYNISVVKGEQITWEVAGTLPKTTLITVDDMLFYIHHCNFTIIDTALFEKVVMPKDLERSDK